LAKTPSISLKPFGGQTGLGEVAGIGFFFAADAIGELGSAEKKIAIESARIPILRFRMAQSCLK
jgi:hypothetical protein